MTINDLVPKQIIDELVRLYKVNPNWITVKELGGNRYGATGKIQSWILPLCVSGQDLFAFHSLSNWLGGGPKFFRPTIEQCQALENVDINLTLDHYSQPFPAILVSVDYPPFIRVLVYHNQAERMLTACLYSKKNENDIVTTIRTMDGFIEESVRRFDEDCKEHAETASKALRVALNSCLILSNHEISTNYLYPKEFESDSRLAKEKTERGERARKRVQLAIQQIAFTQEVILHQVERAKSGSGNPTGSERSSHWRRGHWAMQAHGVQHSLRKRIFRKPIMVREDLFIGSIENSQATYRS